MLHTWPGIKDILLKLGIWDTDTDGGIMYWRLDFWNSNVRKWLKTKRR